MARSIFYRLEGGPWTRAQTSVFPYIINGLAAGNYEVDDGLEIHEVVVSPGAVAPQPSLSLSVNVSQNEGDSGTTVYTYTLTLNRDGSTASFPFTWAVAGTGGNPANASDFVGGAVPSGSGTFAPGETSKTIQVQVAGDSAVELDEGFMLTVTATGLNTVTATGTIVNDDVAPAQKLVVLLAAGQSNQEGIIDRDPAVDLDYAGIWQWPSSPNGLAANEQPASLMSDITPLRHNDVGMRPGGAAHSDPANNVSWLSPAEYTARELIEGGYCDKVLVVPCAKGSTPIVTTTTPTWNPTVSNDLTDNAIAQANAAIASLAISGGVATAAPFANHSVEVILSWVQGEKDADNGETLANYRAQHSALFAKFRSQITGAANAKILLGSIVPNWFNPTNVNFTAASQVINHATVLQSLSLTNAFYWRGSNGDVAAPAGKHYAPVAVVREQGRRIAKPLTDPNSRVPTITTGASVGTINGQKFALNLAHDQEHGTFHIVGGADAALFEISDPYLNPQLRWVGDGTGPATDGQRKVQIAARNGAGVYGPTKEFTATVATPVAPTDVSHTPAAGSVFTDNAPSGVRNYAAFANVPLKAGVNYLAIVTDSKVINAVYANNTTGNAAAAGSVTATKVADPDVGTSFDVAIWQVVMSSDGTFPVWVQGSGSGFNVGMAVGALNGAAAGPTDTAIKTSASVGSPASTADTLVVPNHGLGIAVMKFGSAVDASWLDGLTEVGADVVIGTVRMSVAVVPANFNAVVRCAGPTGGQGIAAAAWSLAS